MKNLRIYIVFFLPFFTGFKVYSQDKTNVWFRTTLEVALSQKIEFDLELQHRRQSDFESDNPLEKKLLSAARTWIFYRKSENLNYGISPIAYFSNSKIILKQDDSFSKAINEFRVSGQTEIKYDIVPKLSFSNRTIAEYRIFDGSIANTIRLRNRLGFSYSITKIITATISDEILLNIFGVASRNRFDQNRLNGNLTIKASKKIKFDFGYIFITRKTPAKNEIQKDTNLFLHANYLLN